MIIGKELLVPYIPDFPKFSNSNDKSIVSFAFMKTFPLTFPFTFSNFDSFHLLLVKEFPDNSPIILPSTIISFWNVTFSDKFIVVPLPVPVPLPEPLVLFIGISDIFVILPYLSTVILGKFVVLPYVPILFNFSSNSNDKSIVSLAFIRTFPLTLPFTFNILDSFHLLLVKEFPDNSPIILPSTIISFWNVTNSVLLPFTVRLPSTSKSFCNVNELKVTSDVFFTG